MRVALMDVCQHPRRTQRETQWKLPGEPGGIRMERA